MHHYFIMAFEILFGFFALFTLTKILGKTQISQITTFDFISALVLGELVGNALFDKKAGITEIAVVIASWGVLMWTTEWVTQRFKGSRKLLEGSPSIIIRNGELDREQMKKDKLDINQLQHLLREKDVFSVADVAYAIMETDGTVSVLKTTDSMTPSRADLELPREQVYLSYTLIIDGEPLEDNLKIIQKDVQWLEKQVKKRNFNSIKDIFYGEWTPNGKLLLQDGKGGTVNS